ncbi:Ff.00g043140.m01.CDS01 [Fusarium sp. VM40]|nr:Ff.00g043140.m01.CDS01 [Fusarium sp. VM40]
MKFSTVSAILFAQGIAAMPWSTVKTTQSNSGEITLRIQVAGASSPRLGHFAKPKGSIDPKHYPICLAVCWSDENRCPEGWRAVNNGNDQDPCWTCCHNGEDNDL